MRECRDYIATFKNKDSGETMEVPYWSFGRGNSWENRRNAIEAKEKLFAGENYNEHWNWQFLSTKLAK
jgi:hypothetical protein